MMSSTKTSNRAFAVMLALSLFASCTSLQPIVWPEELPERSFFEASYDADAVNQTYQTRQDYLRWVKDFYTGTVIYPTGWFDIQERVLVTAAPQHVSTLEARVVELGRQIAAEWAKENEIRTIDNRLLALWGSTLQAATPGQQRMEVIELVADDIQRLLSREIDKRSIAESRYDELLGLDSFGDF